MHADMTTEGSILREQLVAGMPSTFGVTLCVFVESYHDRRVFCLTERDRLRKERNEVAAEKKGWELRCNRFVCMS